jgi:hypothetical protein
VIENVYATGNVTGNIDVGGLVGYNYSSTINNAHATGSVNSTGAWYVGGLVGVNYGTIDNSYAKGSVNGDTGVGGLVGWNLHTIKNSYATGHVTGNVDVGGLVGYNGGGVGITTASFWDTEATGQTVSAGGTGKTTAEMKTATTFTNAGWSTVIWDIANGSYPTL